MYSNVSIYYFVGACIWLACLSIVSVFVCVGLRVCVPIGREHDWSISEISKRFSWQMEMHVRCSFRCRFVILQLGNPGWVCLITYCMYRIFRGLPFMSIKHTDAISIYCGLDFICLFIFIFVMVPIRFIIVGIQHITNTSTTREACIVFFALLVI